MARDTNVIHPCRTIRGTDTAAYVVEVLRTHFIPKEPILFAFLLVDAFASFFRQVSAFATLSFWLSAVQAVVSPPLRTIELAIAEDASIAFFADRVAQEPLLLMAFRTRVDRFANSSAVSSFPAAASIDRSCWVNKRIAIIRYHKWYFISWCWLRLNVGCLDCICLKIPWLVSLKNRTTNRRLFLLLILSILFKERLFARLLRNRLIFVFFAFPSELPVFPFVMLYISFGFKFHNNVRIMASC